MTSLARAMMSMLLVMRVAGGGGDSDPPGAELPAGDVDPGQLPWDRIDTVAVLGSGPMWDEPPFYRVFDAVLDNEGDAVFLVNGGDGELIRYDIGSGRTSRIGRRGSGPGEFGRPVWLEPHGPDSLLAYDSESRPLLRLFPIGRLRPDLQAARRRGQGETRRGDDPDGRESLGGAVIGDAARAHGVGNADRHEGPRHRGRSRSDPRGWCLEHGRPRPSRPVGAGARYELLRGHSRRTCHLGDDSRRRGTAVRGDLRRGFAGGVRLSCRRRYGGIVPIPGRADGVAAARAARVAREPGGIVVDRGKGGRIDGVSCVWGVGGGVGPAGKAYLPRDGPDSGRVRGQGCVSAFRRVGPGDGGGWAGG